MNKMLSLILLSIGLISANLPYINTVIIDTTNDAECFARIYKEAMIPPTRVFRTSETNSIRVCKELCMSEGSRCQSFALGISSIGGGNGTCQLSGQRIFEHDGRRPRGTIYDPDYNLYQRKESCRIQDNNEMPPKEEEMPTMITIQTEMPSDRPAIPVITMSTTNTNTMTSSANGGGSDDDRMPTVQSTADTSTMSDVTSSSSTNPMSTNVMSTHPTLSDKPDTTMPENQQTPSNPSTFSSSSSSSSIPTTNMYPNTVDSTKGPGIPPTMITTTMDRFPSTSTTYGSPNTDLSTNEVKPQTYPPTIYMSNGGGGSSNKPNDFGYPYTPHYHHKYNFYHDMYPFYTYPTLYETNYPSSYPAMPSSGGGGYAQTLPTISYTPTVDYYGTTPSMTTYGGNTNTASTYMGNGWSNADEIYRRKNGGIYPDRDNSGSYPEGKYNGTRAPDTIPYIRTYFNPDDYITNAEAKKKPTSNGGDSGDVNGGSNKYDYRPSTTLDNRRPCFRRALAGKRVAPQWVRRTLMCERVDDCQAECALEKRFSCEGFNYRLDPSGQGQGICELIDVPLAEIDIYSSPSRRDENLLFHPDYDYYERDRSACRPSFCKDCGSGSGGKPYLPRPDSQPPTKYFPEPPPSSYNDGGHINEDHDRDRNRDRDRDHTPHSGGKPYLPTPPDYNTPPTTYRPIDNFKPYSDSRPSSHHDSGGGDYHSSDRFQPPYENTAIDKYRPPPFDYYEHRPPPDAFEYNRYDSHSHFSSSGYRPPNYDLDRYDNVKPIDRPIYSEISIYNDPPPHFPRPSYSQDNDYHPPRRPPPPPPPPSSNDYLGPYKPPPHDSAFSSFGYRPKKPEHYPPSYNYLDRERESPPPPNYKPQKPPQSQPFIPYTINKDAGSWATYGGNYGGAQHYNHQSQDFWGLSNENKRHDANFNYFNLGNGPKINPNENAVLSYPGSKYDTGYSHEYDKDKNYYGSLWTRRPGQDDCSVKTSEGFRLHKAVIRYVYNVPTVTECERMCYSETKFRCVTYSYKYSPQTRDNCLLCDRPMSHLDFYTDVEPNRDYDIYSMADDPHMCTNPVANTHGRHENNAQCFFRAIDLTRFYKSIVRDSLTVRSVGECEMECIKTTKFTCRAFSYRYGPKTPGSIIDNCQLSDWPVRDMDKDRHLIHDSAFDVYERASYGHGCEIQPITDDKHKKLCYLGYGSPAKLLSSAIKKVVSVPTELDCKNECIRFRENSSFKCYSFSFGSQASTFNCEMSDLDQSELKLNVHYAHTNDRDYWLFAWNPFDFTCRDKVATIGGSNRANNDRRMDIFREKDGENTWSHFTVSGKACRMGSSCNKNLVTGFYSCEIDGDEVGAWDYCCKADYPCGYSQGFDYPWCFVGEGPDQWRTCSDRYFPLSSSSTSNSHVSSSSSNSGSNNSSNKKKTSPISYTSNKRKGTNTNDSYHQQPPRPGGLQNLEDIASARLWPITYLYSSGPPNSTELSNFVDCNKETC